MANLFETDDSSKLIESIDLENMKDMPTPLEGAKTCTKFTTGSKSFGFCFANEEILKQVIVAYEYLHKCRSGDPNGTGDMLKLLLESCNLDKIDFGNKGPLGKMGPVYSKMIENYKKTHKKLNAVDPELKYDPKKISSYYSVYNVPGTLA